MASKTLHDVVCRVRSATGTQLQQQDCVALALAMSLEEGSICRDACEHIASPANAEAVLKSKAIALTAREYDELIGSAGEQRVSDSGIGNLLQSAQLSDHVSKMERSLRCTLDEASCKAAWQQSLKKMTFYYALHKDADNHPACSEVSTLLGSFVEADRRRVEDLQYEVQESNHTHLLCPCLLALARCATAA